MDRYLNSVSLAVWGIDQKFTFAGTMRHDRRDIPKEIKILKDTEEKSTIFAHRSEKNTMMVSYIDKKKSEKKNVICLTTMHKRVKVTNDQRLKPQVIVMYNQKTVNTAFSLNIISFCTLSSVLYPFLFDTAVSGDKKY